MSELQSEGSFLRHDPCPDCGSSDALGVFTDHTFCFSCGVYTPGDGEAKSTQPRRKVAGLIDPGSPQAIGARALTAETCRLWGYTTTKFKDEWVQVANYKDEAGNIIAQKVRNKAKDFIFLGEPKEASLYGQHLWRTGGKRLIITEGEIDALSVSQAQSNKWPVVSVKTGAQGAKKDLAKQLEWLNTFDKIVLNFDNDDAGKKAVEECVRLFPPGKVAVAYLPLKDANEMLKAGKSAELISRLWEAQDYRPDGIVSLADVREKALVPPEWGLPWFLPELTNFTFGRRYAEAVALGAGTGVGKTDFLMEQIAYDIGTLKKDVAVFAFEQVPSALVQQIAGKLASKRFHVPDGSWKKEELAAAIDRMENGGRLFIYDHFGAAEWDIVKERIRYLAHSEGVKLFYLDHLTALAESGENERGSVETIMKELGGLVQELGIWLLFVSHLATPEGKSHEEGGRVTIKQFKGSRSIGFWSVFMFGMERDQQSEDEELRTTTTFRVLKDRLTGQSTGKTLPLKYDAKSGRMSVAQSNEQGDSF